MEFSVEVDIAAFKRDPVGQFKVGIKKMGSKEVNLKKLTPVERKRLEAGKQKEISSWLKYKVCRGVPASMAKGKLLMKMRWVLTFKADGTGKGRIVVRGYQSPNLGCVRTEAPTASRRAKHLFK